jgi:hypothetical protein
MADIATCSTREQQLMIAESRRGRSRGCTFDLFIFLPRG